ncbi:MAG: hypothetical protein WA864_05580 [Acetobacteraceae bacterium]
MSDTTEAAGWARVLRHNRPSKFVRDPAGRDLEHTVAVPADLLSQWNEDLLTLHMLMDNGHVALAIVNTMVRQLRGARKLIAENEAQANADAEAEAEAEDNDDTHQEDC